MKAVEKIESSEILFPDLDDLRYVNIAKGLMIDLLAEISGEKASKSSILWTQLIELRDKSDFLMESLPMLPAESPFENNSSLAFNSSLYILPEEFKNFIKKWSDLDSPENYYSYIHSLIAKSENEPVKLNFISYEDEDLWMYKTNIYITRGLYSDDEFRLLIFEEFDKERRLFERLRQKFDTPYVHEEAYNRPRIPESVRIEVWRRDSGKCARCGSHENLEYDHIVPVSRGGSNTARNIELLCEKCNRTKHNNIA